VQAPINRWRTIVGLQIDFGFGTAFCQRDGRLLHAGSIQSIQQPGFGESFGGTAPPSNAFADTDANTYAESNPHAYSLALSDANSFTDTNTHANAFAYSDPDSITNPDTNAPLRRLCLGPEPLDGCAGLQGVSERGKRWPLHIRLRNDTGKNTANYGFLSTPRIDVLLRHHQHRYQRP